MPTLLSLIFYLLSFISYCLILRGLVDEFEELIKLGRDDDLGAAVTVLAGSRVVADQRIVLATTTCGKTLGIDAVVVLQGLYHR